MDILGGIGAVATLGSGIVNAIGQNKANKANAKEAQKNRDWQTKERIAQNDWNEKMYQRQYNDNSIQNQVKQMKEAGLNPATLTGNAFTPANSPSSASVSGVSNPSMSSESFGMASALQQLAMQQAQISNMKADTEQKEAQTQKTSEETRYIGKMAMSQIGLNDAEIAKMGEDVQVAWARVDMEYSRNQKEIELIESQIGINTEMEYMQQVKNAYLPLQIMRELEVMASQVDLNRADADLKRSGIKLNASTMRYLAKQCEYLGKLSEKCDWEVVNEMNSLLLGSADLDRKKIDNEIAEKYGKSWLANHPTESHYIDEAIDIFKSVLPMVGSLGGASIIANGAKGAAQMAKRTTYTKNTKVYNRESGNVDNVQEVWNY